MVSAKIHSTFDRAGRPCAGYAEYQPTTSKMTWLAPA
jgi:hypothetical protein